MAGGKHGAVQAIEHDDVLPPLQRDPLPDPFRFIDAIIGELVENVEEHIDACVQQLEEYEWNKQSQRVTLHVSPAAALGQNTVVTALSTLSADASVCVVGTQSGNLHLLHLGSESQLGTTSPSDCSAHSGRPIECLQLASSLGEMATKRSESSDPTLAQAAGESTAAYSTTLARVASASDSYLAVHELRHTTENDHASQPAHGSELSAQSESYVLEVLYSIQLPGSSLPQQVGVSSAPSELVAHASLADGTLHFLRADGDSSCIIPSQSYEASAHVNYLTHEPSRFCTASSKTSHNPEVHGFFLWWTGDATVRALNGKHS